MTLSVIGYWRNAEHPEYPAPSDHIDATWDEDERHTVAGYLSSGTYLRGFMGYSPYRICGEANGSGEYTDGFLVWPEGLAHYLIDHAVRLPSAVVVHILQRTDDLEQEPIIDTWWVDGAVTPLT